MRKMSENARLRMEITNLAEDICNDIDHGECLYDKEMLDELANKLDSLKHLAYRYNSFNTNIVVEDGF